MLLFLGLDVSDVSDRSDVSERDRERIRESLLLHRLKLRAGEGMEYKRQLIHLRRRVGDATVALHVALDAQECHALDCAGLGVAYLAQVAFYVVEHFFSVELGVLSEEL